MPPPGGPPWPPADGASFFSTINASVVSNKPRDRRGVLKRSARNLGRVDNAGLHEILVHIRKCVITEGLLLRSADLLDHDRAFATGILYDHAKAAPRLHDERCRHQSARQAQRPLRP